MAGRADLPPAPLTHLDKLANGGSSVGLAVHRGPRGRCPRRWVRATSSSLPTVPGGRATDGFAFPVPGDPHVQWSASSPPAPALRAPPCSARNPGDRGG